VRPERFDFIRASFAHALRSPSRARASARRSRNDSFEARSTFYTIHVGSIGGVPGRIVGFAACVAGFTLPFTGVVLWINRLRRKKTKKSHGRERAKAAAFPEEIAEEIVVASERR
jgi:uncharacterized iron-regulated membrane protein